MSPMFETREPSIEALRAAPVYFRYGSSKRRMLIDATTARAMLVCYDAMSEPNRAKFARMVSGSPQQLSRLAAFCFKHVSFS